MTARYWRAPISFAQACPWNSSFLNPRVWKMRLGACGQRRIRRTDDAACEMLCRSMKLQAILFFLAGRLHQAGSGRHRLPSTTAVESQLIAHKQPVHEAALSLSSQAKRSPPKKLAPNTFSRLLFIRFQPGDSPC